MFHPPSAFLAPHGCVPCEYRPWFYYKDTQHVCLPVFHERVWVLVLRYSPFLVSLIRSILNILRVLGLSGHSLTWPLSKYSSGCPRGFLVFGSLGFSRHDSHLPKCTSPFPALMALLAPPSLTHLKLPELSDRRHRVQHDLDGRSIQNPLNKKLGLEWAVSKGLCPKCLVSHFLTSDTFLTISKTHSCFQNALRLFLAHQTQKHTLTLFICFFLLFSAYMGFLENMVK